MSLTDLPDELVAHIFEMIPTACCFSTQDSWRAASALATTCKRFRALLHVSIPRIALFPEDSNFSEQDTHCLITAALPTVRTIRLARPWVRIAQSIALLKSAPAPRLIELRLSELTSRSNLHPNELISAVRHLGPRLRILEISVSPTFFPIAHDRHAPSPPYSNHHVARITRSICTPSAIYMPS